MSDLRLNCVLALVLTSSIATAAPLEIREAEAFLRRVYAPYVAGDAQVAPTGDMAPTIFDAHLTALLREDTAKAKGEVGALDQDPICACQDFERIKGLSIKIRSGVSGSLKAAVRFVNGTTPTSLTYTLTPAGSSWLVKDISTKDMPSLASLLEKANASRR